MSGTASSLRSKLPMLIGAVFMLLFTAGVILMVKNFIATAQQPERVHVQKISLIMPPPPRDLPKPPEPEKKIEQPKPEEKFADPTPSPDQPKDQGPPPGEQLGLDATGGAGGDAFGLVGKKGGRDITTIGGGGGSRARWYAGLLAERIENSVNRDPELVKQLKGKRPVVKVWVDTGGKVERVDCDSDLPDKISSELKDKLLNLSLSEPPEGVAQPIWYRLRARAG